MKHDRVQLQSVVIEFRLNKDFMHLWILKLIHFCLKYLVGLIPINGKPYLSLHPRCWSSCFIILRIEWILERHILWTCTGRGQHSGIAINADAP